jgi:DNA-binding NarL/FixJ family response regulator
MAEEREIRVLIADDFDIMRQVIHVLLEEAEDIRVVGEAPHVAEALAEATKLQPDVIILNCDLPPLDSAQATERLRELGISAPILIVSMHMEPDLMRRSFNSGANGFMHKDEMGECLVDAVRRVHGGGQYLSPKTERALGSGPD